MELQWGRMGSLEWLRIKMIGNLLQWKTNPRPVEDDGTRTIERGLANAECGIKKPTIANPV